MGGSSAINALAYQRGHPAAFDRLPEGWLRRCSARGGTGTNIWLSGAAGSRGKLNPVNIGFAEELNVSVVQRSHGLNPD